MTAAWGVFVVKTRKHGRGTLSSVDRWSESHPWELKLGKFRPEISLTNPATAYQSWWWPSHPWEYLCEDGNVP